MGDDFIHIDDELNVTSRYPLALGDMHHLIIGIIKDISMLTPEAQRRFFRNPTLVFAYLDILLGHRPVNGYPKVNSGNGIDVVDVEDYYRVIKENYARRQQRYLELGSAIATVGIFSIKTHSDTE